MARLARSAATLMKQVQEKRSRAKVEVVGEPDGLDVHRSLKFDKTTSKWLAPLLEETDDPRVASTDDEDGHLVVTFVGTGAAETRTPFPLEAAEIVTGE